MPISIDLLRAHRGGEPDMVKESEKKRGRSGDMVDTVISYDAEWRSLRKKCDDIRKERGLLNRRIGDLVKASRGGGAGAVLRSELEALKSRSKDLANGIAQAEEEVSKADAALKEALSRIGNILLPAVRAVEGKDVEVSSWHPPGDELPEKKEQLLSHPKALYCTACVDLQRGSAVAGKRGFFLRGAAVQLQDALKRYGVSFLCRKGFEPVYPPLFMDAGAMETVAELSDFEDTLYSLRQGESYLIATSEQPLAAMHANEWIAKEQLPLRYCGISTCFRSEGGKHGQAEGGIFRVHQFEKVEQFVICDAGSSQEIFDELLSNAKEFVESLGLPYRVIECSSSSLNDAAAVKYDIEAWFPASGRFMEIVSCTNVTDYISRAANIRIGSGGKDSKKWTEKAFVHMVNCTLCATTRIMSAIAEVHQTEEGIALPKVLWEHGFSLPKVIPFVRKPSDVDKRAVSAVRTTAKAKGAKLEGSRKSRVNSTAKAKHRAKKKDAKEMAHREPVKMDRKGDTARFLARAFKDQSFLAGRGFVPTAEDAVVFDELVRRGWTLQAAQDAGSEVARWWRCVSAHGASARSSWPLTADHLRSGRRSMLFDLQN
eukprot:g2129.t1